MHDSAELAVDRWSCMFPMLPCVAFRDQTPSLMTCPTLRCVLVYQLVCDACAHKCKRACKTAVLLLRSPVVSCAMIHRAPWSKLQGSVEWAVPVGQTTHVLVVWFGTIGATIAGAVSVAFAFSRSDFDDKAERDPGVHIVKQSARTRRSISRGARSRSSSHDRRAQ